MMTHMTRLLGLVLSALLLTSCSGTRTSESWTSPDFRGQIKNVYIIGVAKSELNRMVFEDTFEKGFTGQGIKAVASYQDLLPTDQEVDREDIMQRMRNNGCDSVLLTRLIGQRTEASITGGRKTYTFTPQPVSASQAFQKLPKGTESPYGDWANYFNYGQLNLVQPTSADYVILTVESVLYDLHTEGLIWSAQLETTRGGSLESMMQKFVNEVIKDLKAKGLI